MNRILRYLGAVVMTVMGLPAYAALSDTTGIAFNEVAITDSSLIPASSAGDIDFSLDAAGFKGVEGQTYVECYFLFRPGDFTLEERKDKKYQADFSIDLAIKDEMGREITRTLQERAYETDRPVARTRRGEERVMVDQIALSVTPGSYRIEAVVTDLKSKRVGRASRPFVADAFGDGELMISDIQFATQINQDDSETRFNKNGLLVLPNPMRIYEKWAEMPGEGKYQPRNMYMYIELYNLAQDPAGSTYNLTYAVQGHKTGMKYPLPPQKNIKKPGVDGLKVIGLDYMSFPPDVYTLEVTVQDNANNALVTRQTIFEVVQPPLPPPPITTLTEDQAKQGFRRLKLLASPRDLALYEKLDLDGKTEFLINFWKNLDPTPDTPENELMIAFNERFSFADYQLGGAEGDRGKVFMRYGEPEEIERHDSDNNMKSFQIWYYTGGVNGDAGRRDGGNRDYFVFGDRLGVGKYELLHSSAKGEIYNPDWRSQLLLRRDLFDPAGGQYDPTTPAGKEGEGDPK